MLKRVQHDNKMKKETVLEIMKRFEAHNPEPKSELNYYSNYTLLIAVALSAQATDVGVNKITPALFKAADTAEKMVTLGLTKITDHVKSINYYKTKAKNILALSEKLISDFKGEVPDTLEELMSLPGVGQKTANVVLSNAFGQDRIAVDTHIFRLSNRLKLAPGSTPLKVEEKLMKVIPQKYIQGAHHWLILHGRYICKARKPLCSQCFIADCCPYPDKNL